MKRNFHLLMLVFSANDGDNHGREFWRSDGTTDGTFLVKDIWSGSGDSTPQFQFASGNLATIGVLLFFGADDGVNGRELWKSDGTEGGTILVRDILPGPRSSGVHSLIFSNDSIFFAADNGLYGDELWRVVLGNFQFYIPFVSE